MASPKMELPSLQIHIITILLVLVISHDIEAQNITSTTLRDGQVACANTDVTFTCETRGSSAIAWRSEYFIGVGSTAQLIFSDVDNPGRMQSVSTTVAMLTKNQLENGAQLLESTLRVRAPASSTTLLSVTCLHLENNMNTTTSFTIRPVPDEVRYATVVQVPCANSSACLAVASWYPPINSESANVTHYTVNVSVVGEDVFNTTQNISVAPNEDALSAYYVIPNCTDEYLQKSNVTVSGFAVNECGEGQIQDALLLLSPADNIGHSKVSCPANSSPTGTVTSSPNASSATELSIGLLYGAIVLAFMKTSF